ncbi:glycosyltransferase family 2 protein [Bizionia saleffrena]|uniref:Glycosyltransferase family 2 protein n=1 Tax=Bizionia saleffrena TaxID=291189 RepID=A0A8H2LPQ6_9FLAO|nr:glycosyltransferase family A protein [Bizionia saleffrena]TYB80156.1 glycosyltransferase family 2 protein [Bizionia saleffrena]
MIVVLHNKGFITKVLDNNQQCIADFVIGKPVAEGLLDLANGFSTDLLIWCYEPDYKNLNRAALPDIFHHERIFASYQPASQEYLPNALGYIDRSCFVSVNKTVRYPTWLASAQVGGIHASVLLKMSTHLKLDADFNYFLNSLAKQAMGQGLFCYSEPQLLLQTNTASYTVETTSKYTLFKFVKQHYKWVWVFFLAMSYFIYERKWVLLPLLYSLFYKQIKTNYHLDSIIVQSTRQVVTNQTIDVIIPTMGRKKYLYNVLKDLAQQTVLPKNVIIVEQNPDVNSISELTYLKDESWPFEIKHSFIHQTGACNARNSALSQVSSEWTLLGDDDNSFEPDLIKDFFGSIEQYGVKVVTSVYLQPNEKQIYYVTAQTGIFGSGNSMIKSSLIENIKFDARYEFNYGEDSDFGMQLRHHGVDVVFCADIKITHLKAPMGGFRRPMKQLWDDEAVKPKPSPTIQLLQQSYFTTQQILGYKLLLGIRGYKNNLHKNPFSYFRLFNKRWEQSIYWSRKINKD